MTPELMQIETTTACNATCWMCPRDMATRSTHANRMEERVFRKACREAADLGVTTILPFIDGEPLADPTILDKVEWLAAELPAVEVGWFTNGSLLTEERAIRLLSAGNIRTLNVSVQGWDVESYRKFQGLDWNITYPNIVRLCRLNEERGRPVRIQLQTCVGSEQRPHLDKIRALWGQLPVNLAPGTYTNFGGLSSADPNMERMWDNVPRQPCKRALKHVYVFWDGTVGQCCFDLVASIKYGNVSTQTLREIWDSPLATRMRSAHERVSVSEMPLICRSCIAPKFRG